MDSSATSIIDEISDCIFEMIELSSCSSKDWTFEFEKSCELLTLSINESLPIDTSIKNPFSIGKAGEAG
jgi:hypothetical protein